MNWHRRLGLLYGILVTLILVMGAWWVYYLNREGRNYERYMLQRYATDQVNAAFLIQSDPEIARNPVAALGDTYPHLHFHRDDQGWNVFVDSAAHEAVHTESARRRRMFLTEGLFFLALLIAGTTILNLAFRREREFKRARELFLAGATHELKTPLACIRLYTETLERPDLDDDARRRIHASVLQDIERLENMMEQVLSVSRDESGLKGTPEPLDLATEITELLDAMAAFLEGHDTRLTTDLPAGRIVLGSRQALRVAVRNLVQNAVLHGGKGTQVHVTAATRGDRHHLAVRDNGPGIPRRDRGRIFESFYRCDGHGENGSGLGLYLVKRNAKALGGDVELESEEGKGSTFTLVLPVHEEDSP